MIAYLSIGSNLSDRNKAIKGALSCLANSKSISNVVQSSIIETEPVGNVKQPYFLNCAVRLNTELPVIELLALLQDIEFSLGRKKVLRWGPRIIDLDIIFYGQEIFQQPNLIVPHPEMHKRYFVLHPLMELCPDYIHPVLNKSVRSLYRSISEETGERECYR